MNDFLNFLFRNIDLIVCVSIALIVRFHERRAIQKRIVERIKDKIPFDFLTATEKYKILDVLKEIENE